MSCEDPNRRKRNKKETPLNSKDIMFNDCESEKETPRIGIRQKRVRENFSTSVSNVSECYNEINSDLRNDSEIKRKKFNFRDYLIPGKSNVIGISMSKGLKNNKLNSKTL